MLAGLQHGHAELEMGADRRGDGDRIDRGIAEQVLIVGRRLHRGKAALDQRQLLGEESATAASLTRETSAKISNEVRTPVSVTDYAYVDHQLLASRSEVDFEKFVSANILRRSREMDNVPSRGIVTSPLGCACSGGVGCASRVPDDFRGHAGYDREIGDVLCDDGAGADQCRRSDRQARQNGGVGAN